MLTNSIHTSNYKLNLEDGTAENKQPLFDR